jgi:hypothetical protein
MPRTSDEFLTPKRLRDFWSSGADTPLKDRVPPRGGERGRGQFQTVTREVSDWASGAFAISLRAPLGSPPSKSYSTNSSGCMSARNLHCADPGNTKHLPDLLPFQAARHA